MCFTGAFFIGVADRGNLCCSEPYFKSQKFLATIHLMDSKHLILNLLVAPAGGVSSQQIATKAPLASTQVSQRQSVTSSVV